MAISGSQAPVFFADNSSEKLNTFLNTTKPSLIIILVDSNTHEYCLSRFLQTLETNIKIEVIEIENGEEYKNIDTCSGVWNALAELGADRKSVMLNLGGGVVTDLGGFVASTFKRGITYINIPTTLLAMVDASIGGKTGVDLGSLKNQIGVITQPEMVIIDSEFLKTLPAEEMRSGLAEIFKHGLIADIEYWNTLKDLSNLNLENLDAIIETSISIKKNIVTNDPLENGERKFLNFGHTLGHAIESYFLENATKKKLLHGEAVAAGMIMASYISYKQHGFSKKELEEICSVIQHYFIKIEIQENDISAIVDYLKYDKKTEHGELNFVLLKAIGKPSYNCKVPQNMILEAISYYNNLE